MVRWLVSVHGISSSVEVQESVLELARTREPQAFCSRMRTLTTRKLTSSRDDWEINEPDDAGLNESLDIGTGHI